MDTFTPTSEQIYRGVKFPLLNKNSTISENEEEVNQFYIRNVIVRKMIIVEHDEWQDISESLLQDREIWNRIGGSALLDSDERIEEFNPSFIWTQEMLDYFTKKSFVNVVFVRCKTKGFFVNTEGYNYARYVSKVYPLVNSIGK